MGTLADAFVRVMPMMDRFGPDLASKTENAAGTVGTSSGKKFGTSMLGAMSGVFAAGAVVGFFKGAFDEAAEAVKMGRLTEAVIKSTGSAAHVTSSQVGDLANSLSTMSGVDDEVIQNAENVLLTFTKVRNEAGKGNDIFDQGTLAALNLSAALGTDLQSASTLVGKALNDPVSGLTALKKAGIQFTDAQKDQIKAMVDSGNTMGAQKLILGELTAQFGGAAEAAASPADKARVAWGNFQEMIGLKLLPALNAMLQFGLANQDWLVPLVGAIAALGVVVGVVSVATTVWAAAQAVGSAAAGIWTGVQWLLNASFYGFPVVWIIVAIVALVAAIWWIVANWDKVSAWLAGAWQWLKDTASAIFGSIVDAIVGAWNTAFEWTRNLLASIVAFIVGAWTSAVDWTRNLLTAIVTKIGEVVGWFQALPGRILAFLLALPGMLLALAAEMMQRFLFAVGFGIGLVIKAFIELPPMIWSLILSLWNGAVQLTAQGIAWMVAYVEALPGRVWALLTLLWTTAVAIVAAGIAWVLAFFAALPGQVGAQVSALWTDVTGRFWRGVDVVVSFVSGLPAKISAQFNNAKAQAIAIATGLVNGVIDWFQQLPGRAATALGALAGAVKGALSAAGTWLLQSGRDIISGLINGITGAIGGAIKAVKSAIGDIVAGAKSAIGAKSPSTVFADQVGRWIPAGIAVGIDRYADVARASVVRLTDALKVDATTGQAEGATGAMGRVVDMLQKVVDAVDRVAPGVGTEINGSVGVARVVGRSR